MLARGAAAQGAGDHRPPAWRPAARAQRGGCVRAARRVCAQHSGCVCCATCEPVLAQIVQDTKPSPLQAECISRPACSRSLFGGRPSGILHTLLLPCFLRGVRVGKKLGGLGMSITVGIAQTRGCSHKCAPDTRHACIILAHLRSHQFGCTAPHVRRPTPRHRRGHTRTGNDGMLAARRACRPKPQAQS